MLKDLTVSSSHAHCAKRTPDQHLLLCATQLKSSEGGVGYCSLISPREEEICHNSMLKISGDDNPFILTVTY